MLRSGRRVAAVLLVFLSLVTGGTTATAVTTAGPCYKGTCTGRSPLARVNNVACADDALSVAADGHLYNPLSSGPYGMNGFHGWYVPVTTLAGYTDYIWLELRYSARCVATWARVYSRGNPNFHGELSVWVPGEVSQKTTIGYDGSGNWFTPMVRGGVPNCFGMQVYQNGIYRGWHFVACW